MYTKQALHELDIGPSALSDEQKAQLDNDGFFIVNGLLSAAACKTYTDTFELLHAAEVETGGQEVHIEPGARRVSNIFNKTEAFDTLLALPVILAAAHHLLGEIKLHGANLRDPDPGYGHQDYHADVPKLFQEDWWVLNAILLFDDMTLDNGPTRVVPGSHQWAPINVPTVNLGDWTPQPLTEEDAARIPADLATAYPGEVLVTAPAGSAVIINSSLWHSGTKKMSDAPRRVLHLSYTRRDLPQQLTQIDHLTQPLYDRMNAAQRYLMEIEPESGHSVKRQSKHKSAGWWN